MIKIRTPRVKTVKKNAVELVREFEKVPEPKRVETFRDRMPTDLKESCDRARNRSSGKRR